jgi:hypothetical protein
MSLTDEFCKSPDLRRKERILCYQLASDFQYMIHDLDNKGYLRSELKEEEGKEDRNKIMNVLWNVRKITHAFNMFFDMYVDKIKPDSKHRLKKFLDLNRPYGLTEDDLRYLLYSQMIFVYLQNAEEFRTALLFIMELDKDKKINKKTTLGKLLARLKELKIKKAETLTDTEGAIYVDYQLRNALSHGLFWFDDKGDLHYAKDVTFQNVSWTSLPDFYSKMRNQSIYTNCLLNVIADWFT